MMKSKTMRAGVLLLALTLITSCFVGGTFAKYTTAGEGSDSARVAKFGVQVVVEGDSMFSNTYASDSVSTYASATVVSSDNNKVVAPGTKSGDNKATFSITGTPEVAVKVDIDMTVDEDIFLKGGANVSYTDWTKAPYDETFSQGTDYYPVVFTLKQVSNADGEMQNAETIATGNLDEIKTAIETYANSATYAPNTKLDAEFELSWEWEFENNNDKADTLLGNLAADSSTFGDGLTDGTDYNLDLSYELKITVTQID